MSSKSQVPVEEEELVQRLHSTVGGPVALSNYDDPAVARNAVIAALASLKSDVGEVRRIEGGNFTSLERRAMRTLTNRGAAMRSRARQRRELERLHEQLRRKDEQVQRLEAAICALLASNAEAAKAVAPPTIALSPRPAPQACFNRPQDMLFVPSSQPVPDFDPVKMFVDSPVSCSGVSAGTELVLPSTPPPTSSLEGKSFCNLIDELNSMMS